MKTKLFVWVFILPLLVQTLFSPAFALETEKPQTVKVGFLPLTAII